jgi:hypothetical protein
VLAGAFGQADLGSERYDTIFAVNVNLFWVRSCAAELDLVKRLLKPGGALYLFYEICSTSHPMPGGPMSSPPQ